MDTKDNLPQIEVVSQHELREWLMKNHAQSRSFWLVTHKNPSAASFFENLNPSSKRFALRWLKLSKTEKTRKKRITQIVVLAAKGEKIRGS